MDVPPWLSSSKAPSDWSADTGSTSTGYQPAVLTAPAADMEIEHVYGYSGSSSLDALFCTAAGKMIYPAACVCVVHDMAHGRQRFFAGHDNAVVSLDLHPEGRLVGSGDVGKSSQVLVWDSENPDVAPMASLWPPAPTARLAFSRDGNRLVTVGRDADHQMCLWDWRKEERLAWAKTGPSAILAIRFDPVSAGIITAGVRHLKLWTMQGAQLEAECADFSRKGSLQTFVSLAFMKVRSKEETAVAHTLCGCQDGSLYVFDRGLKLVSAEKKSHDGPINSIVAPYRASEECGNYAITGGADGKIRRWDAHQTVGLTPIWTVDLEEKTRVLFSPFSSKRFPVRGLGISNNMIYVGTCMNEIYQFVLEPTPPGKAARSPECQALVTQAHTAGSVYSLDVHPLQQQFATVAYDSTLRVWDCEARQCVRAVQLMSFDDERTSGTAVQYSPDGEHLAVALETGEIWVFDSTALAAAAAWVSDCDKLFVRNDDDEPVKRHAHKGTATSVLRYRPDGALLAAASLGGKISIFLVPGDYERIKVVPAHACNIRSMDFSEDCLLLQSTDTENRIHYMAFESDEGEISPELLGEASGKGMQDVPWATWTSALGWPVQGIYDTNRHDQHARMSALGARDLRLLLAWEDKDVMLYNLPCAHGSAARRLRGHASVPADARLLHNGRGLVTAGTADMCLIQWRPRGALDATEEDLDPEIRCLIARASRARTEGVVVRMSFDEQAEIAVESDQAAKKWAEVHKGLAEVLKCGEERLELVRMMMGSLVFDICLRPHALGHSVEPTAGTLLQRLQVQYDQGLISRKFPKVLEMLTVVQEAQEEDDDFLGIKPWLAVIASPSDWSPDKGSSLLNYSPCSIMKPAEDGTDGQDGGVGTDAGGAGMLVRKARQPELIGYEGQLQHALPASDDGQPDSSKALLELEHVHGYNGWLGGGNVMFLDQEQVVFTAGCFGVIHHLPSNTQRFMAGHDDQMSCIAQEPTELGASTCRFATGQLGQRGSICLWDAMAGPGTPKLLCTLGGFHNGDVAAVCFLGTDMLVSVGTDSEHQIAVWDLEGKALVCSQRGDVNAILALDSAGCSEDDEGEEMEVFVSVGVRHMKFWSMADERIVSRGGIFGNKGRVQTMLCVKSFFETNDVGLAQLVSLTGTQDGSIYVWKDRMLWQNLREVHTGPVFAMCLTASCAEWKGSQYTLNEDSSHHLVLTAGKDGIIRVANYDMSQGLSSLFAIDTTQLPVTPHLAAVRHSVRALAAAPVGNGWLRVAFGTGANHLMQLELDVRNPKDLKVLTHTVRTVVHGHAGVADEAAAGLSALCTHPGEPPAETDALRFRG